MIQSPQNGEGTVRAETVYGLCHRGAALRSSSSPGEETGSRKPQREVLSN